MAECDFKWSLFSSDYTSVCTACAAHTFQNEAIKNNDGVHLKIKSDDRMRSPRCNEESSILFPLAFFVEALPDLFFYVFFYFSWKQILCI